jgi:hypothetical protein
LSSLATKFNFLDILNDVPSVSVAKELIQKLRDDPWDNLLENVIFFLQAI